MQLLKGTKLRKVAGWMDRTWFIKIGEDLAGSLIPGREISLTLPGC